MLNKVVSSEYGTFIRINKAKARRLFNDGKKISVMTIDRNPVNSFTSEIDYQLGSKLFWNYDKMAKSFDDVLEDFADWQENDGYGHIPDKYKARHELFSYWVRKAA